RPVRNDDDGRDGRGRRRGRFVGAAVLVFEAVAYFGGGRAAIVGIGHAVAVVVEIGASVVVEVAVDVLGLIGAAIDVVGHTITVGVERGRCRRGRWRRLSVERD